MLEVQKIEARTKMVQNPDGKWEFVADDDPRADDAKHMLAYSIVVIEGVQYPVDPIDPFRWTPGWNNWLD